MPTGRGNGTKVEVLIGSNAEEHAHFLIPSGIVDFVDDDRMAAAMTLVGAEPGAVCATYRAALPDASPGELLSAALTELVLPFAGGPGR